MMQHSQPFITAYGESPLIVMTEYQPGDQQVRATVVRPRELKLLAAGRSWDEAHWELFNQLLSEYMNLDRNRSQLGELQLLRLSQLDSLRVDGTLKLIASIARAGFPAELHEAGRPAPTRVELPG